MSSEDMRMSSDREHKTALAVQMVESERQRQDERWGEQRHGMPVWLAVLMEEAGEASQAVLRLRTIPLEDGHRRRLAIHALQSEVVQVAAVAVAMLEHINDAIADADVLPGEVWQ